MVKKKEEPKIVEKPKGLQRKLLVPGEKKLSDQFEMLINEKQSIVPQLKIIRSHLHYHKVEPKAELNKEINEKNKVEVEELVSPHSNIFLSLIDATTPQTKLSHKNTHHTLTPRGNKSPFNFGDSESSKIIENQRRHSESRKGGREEEQKQNDWDGRTENLENSREKQMNISKSVKEMDIFERKDSMNQKTNCLAVSLIKKRALELNKMQKQQKESESARNFKSIDVLGDFEHSVTSDAHFLNSHREDNSVERLISDHKFKSKSTLKFEEGTFTERKALKISLVKKHADSQFKEQQKKNAAQQLEIEDF